MAKSTDKKPEHTEVFNGDASEMRDSPWLAAEDVRAVGEMRAVITQVFKHENVEFKQGRKKPIAYSLQFQATERQLLLNATNRSEIMKKCGTYAPDWIGAELVLYVDESVRCGDNVGGVRIRSITKAEKQDTVLDIWRGRFKGLSQSNAAQTIAAMIADAFEAKSTEQLDAAHAAIKKLDAADDEKWGERLTSFAGDVLDAISKGETDGNVG